MDYKSISSTVVLALAYSIFLSFETVSWGSAAQDPPYPTEQFRPFIEELTVILTGSITLEEKERVQRRKRIMEVAVGYFDFQEMSRRVLSKTWKTLSKEEQQQFTTVFTTLLEHTYLGKIESYAEQRVEFKSQRIKEGRAQVVTRIVGTNGSDISVSYTMLLQDNRWKVYDIAVKGVSLVRNYKEQFREILRREKYAVLLQQIEKKVTTLNPGAI